MSFRLKMFTLKNEENKYELKCKRIIGNEMYWIRIRELCVIESSLPFNARDKWYFKYCRNDRKISRKKKDNERQTTVWNKRLEFVCVVFVFFFACFTGIIITIHCQSPVWRPYVSSNTIFSVSFHCCVYTELIHSMKSAWSFRLLFIKFRTPNRSTYYNPIVSMPCGWCSTTHIRKVALLIEQWTINLRWFRFFLLVTLVAFCSMLSHTYGCGSRVDHFFLLFVSSSFSFHRCRVVFMLIV